MRGHKVWPSVDTIAQPYFMGPNYVHILRTGRSPVFNVLVFERNSSRLCENSEAYEGRARWIRRRSPRGRHMSLVNASGFESCSLPLRHGVFTQSASVVHRSGRCRRGRPTYRSRNRARGHWLTVKRADRVAPRGATWASTIAALGSSPDFCLEDLGEPLAGPSASVTNMIATAFEYASGT
jgi:hypothetical protein